MGSRKAIIIAPQIGDRIRRRTVVSIVSHHDGHDNHARTYFLVKCDCGSEDYIRKEALLNGDQCQKCRYVVGTVPESHYKRLYNKVSNAIYRCTNPTNKKFHQYGGRGIRVHQPWIDNRLDFIKYIMTLSGWDDRTLVLDRIDNDGHYEPGNLRFVTYEESSLNSRHWERSITDE